MTNTYSLGRIVEHDPRSRLYGIRETVDPIKTVDWIRRVPIFNQGDLGDCVGMSFAGLIGTDSKDRKGATRIPVTSDSYQIFISGSYAVNTTFAIRVYMLATHLDNYPGSYPPNDSGTSGLAGAKALQKMGIVGGYQHAFSVLALKTALQSGPAAIGIPWYTSMFDPAPSGIIPVQPVSGLAGGHELEVTGYNAATKYFTLANSWGRAWGVRGYGYLSEVDMGHLLADQGDVTIPVYSQLRGV